MIKKNLKCFHVDCQDIDTSIKFMTFIITFSPLSL